MGSRPRGSPFTFLFYSAPGSRGSGTGNSKHLGIAPGPQSKRLERAVGSFFPAGWNRISRWGWQAGGYLGEAAVSSSFCSCCVGFPKRVVLPPTHFLCLKLRKYMNYANFSAEIIATRMVFSQSKFHTIPHRLGEKIPLISVKHPFFKAGKPIPPGWHGIVRAWIYASCEPAPKG